MMQPAWADFFVHFINITNLRQYYNRAMLSLAILMKVLKVILSIDFELPVVRIIY